MKNEKERTVTLNDRGIVSIVFIILILTFALGFMTSRSGREQVTVFTREDLDRIVTLQEIEDETGSGADIRAYKDRDGNLMIGWDYND